MKKYFLLLSLVGLALTAAGANAAPAIANAEPYQMPAYRVVASRYTPAEREIERNLEELRAAAKKPLLVRVELPSFADRMSIRYLASKRPLLRLTAKS